MATSPGNIFVTVKVIIEIKKRVIEEDEKENEYFEPTQINPLNFYEGDKVIQSRFGQSIRFSGYNNIENVLAGEGADLIYLDQLLKIKLNILYFHHFCISQLRFWTIPLTCV